MLRPERMSKVSITGSKAVMEAAIHELHRLGLVHLEEYDETWEAFRTGDPLEGAESASELLVTVRSLENTLDLDASDAGPADVTDVDAAVERLEAVRTQVNELEDARASVRDELRELATERDRLEPLSRLGIDFELLRGYDSIEVAVGRGTPERLREALETAEAVAAFDVFAEGDVVALAVRPAEEAEGALTDALVGVEFDRIEVPDAEGDPADRRRVIDRQITQRENRLARIETDLEDVRLEHGPFLLALEEVLSIEVERAEAPLRFATTEHAFVAEGWIPSRQFDELERAMAATVGDRVEVDELERVPYRPPHEREVAADGGRPEMHGGEPPVIQRNPAIVRPFEVFVKTVNRPKYHELDPTIFVFLTFPLAFGYMIGDMGYGLIYVLMGMALRRYADGDALKALGTIAVWAGGFTMGFGFLYDEIFGIHTHDLGLAIPLTGTLSKGLQLVEVAQLWIIASILFGVLHLSVGYAMGFLNDREHGFGHAFAENAAWLLVLWGIFAWIFTSNEAGEPPSVLESVGLGDTDITATGIKPAFLVGTDGVLYENELVDIGFVGFSPTAAAVALVAILVGVVFVYRGEGFIGIIEIPTKAFGHAVSYIRLMAVLLAKAGMAFAVNLLVWGGYEDHGYVAFNLPTYDVSGYTEVFPGLVHIDPWFLTIPLAVLVFVGGHVLVLLLGITAAGIQMTRLEYVEFFGKFYEGGGGSFEPFGYNRAYTREN
ncbi:MAG: V-type ATP synthase subunit I [Halobacteriales archaeon]